MADERGVDSGSGRGRRECLSCGAFTDGERCEACGATALAPPRRRLATSRLVNAPPARFARGLTRTGRPD